MKFLHFNFSHPVKGRAHFSAPSGLKPPGHVVFDTGNETCLKIPVQDCQTGTWQILLEWEFDDRTFCYVREFHIGTAS